jgi:CheY-like chemotaxis protein
MLPGRSGIEVLREIRADPTLRDVAVVVVSAWQAPENVAEALESGADGFLPKPFRVEELESVASDLVERER